MLTNPQFMSGPGNSIKIKKFITSKGCLSSKGWNSGGVRWKLRQSSLQKNKFSFDQDPPKCAQNSSESGPKMDSQLGFLYFAGHIGIEGNNTAMTKIRKWIRAMWSSSKGAWEARSVYLFSCSCEGRGQDTFSLKQSRTCAQNPSEPGHPAEWSITATNIMLKSC